MQINLLKPLCMQSRSVARLVMTLQPLYRMYITNNTIPQPNYDVPIRTKSVSLNERPRSKYDRVKSAGQKQFHTSTEPDISKPRRKPSVVTVKSRRKPPAAKTPCAVSIQTISLPMRFAGEQGLSHPPRSTRTSRARPHTSLHTQVSRTADCTHNRLLLQISEAEQVADFERLLGVNAILYRPRPSSVYSLRAVTRAHHLLFRRHLDELRPLIEQYRRLRGCPPLAHPAPAPLTTLYDLSTFYDDDDALRRQLELVTDGIVAEQLRAGRERLAHTAVVGRRALCSPEGWLAPSMSADRDEAADHVEEVVRSLDSVSLQDGGVPAITFSDCSEQKARDPPAAAPRTIHLTVPSVNSVDESRPPLL